MILEMKGKVSEVPIQKLFDKIKSCPLLDRKRQRTAIGIVEVWIVEVSFIQRRQPHHSFCIFSPPTKRSGSRSLRGRNSRDSDWTIQSTRVRSDACQKMRGSAEEREKRSPLCSEIRDDDD